MSLIPEKPSCDFRLESSLKENTSEKIQKPYSETFPQQMNDIDKLRGICAPLLKAMCYIDPDHMSRSKLIYHQMSPENDFNSDILSGISPETALIDLKEKLEEFSKNLENKDKEKISELIDPLKSGIEKANLIDNYGTSTLNEAELKEYAKHIGQLIEDSIRDLKFGGFIIFPFRTTNHAYIIEISKKEGNQYTLQFINTGLGATEDDDKPGHTKSISYELTLELMSKDFWLPFIEASRNPNLSMNHIYNHLATTLTTKNITPESSRFHRLQRGRNCAFKSLSVWLHGHMAPGASKENRAQEKEKLYEEFKLFMLKKNQESLSTPETAGFIKQNVTIELNRFKVIPLGFSYAKKLESELTKLEEGKIKYHNIFRIVKLLSKVFSKVMVKKLNQDDSLEFLQQRLNRKITKVEKKLQNLN